MALRALKTKGPKGRRLLQAGLHRRHYRDEYGRSTTGVGERGSNERKALANRYRSLRGSPRKNKVLRNKLKVIGDSAPRVHYT